MVLGKVNDSCYIIAPPFLAPIDYDTSSYGISSVSVSTDAEGSFHVVYSYNGEIRYVVFYPNPEYPDYEHYLRTGPYVIYSQGCNSHPFVYAYGDRVYAIWTKQDIEEIVRKWRYLLDPSLENWYPPEDEYDNISQTSYYSSDWGVMDGNAVSWQDKPNNWEIANNLSRTLAEQLYISNTQDIYNAYYPHVNKLYAADTGEVPPPQGVVLYHLWTEERQGGGYNIVFDEREIIPSVMSRGTHANLSIFPVYYEIEGGKPGSFYCLRRAGIFSIDGHSIDYDSTMLIYKLPFLQPWMNYLLEVVVYTPNAFSEFGITTQERLSFDNLKDTTIGLSPGKAETLYCWLPKKGYAEDRKVVLTITGENGGPAILESIKVYEFESLEKKSGFMGVSEVSSSRVTIYSAPNTKGLWIEYDKERIREVMVYDATGRLVKTIRTNTHRLYWDRRDAWGREVSSGVYFVKVKTDKNVLVSKVVLWR